MNPNISDQLLSIDDLKNRYIFINGKAVAVRCNYCRRWVFYDDAECYGCGAVKPKFPSPKTDLDQKLKYA